MKNVEIIERGRKGNRVKKKREKRVNKIEKKDFKKEEELMLEIEKERGEMDNKKWVGN